jgi:phasin family protein
MPAGNAAAAQLKERIMSNPDIEQVSVAQKASAELLMAIMRTSFEGMQRLTELNMAAARETYSTTVATTGKLASSKDMSDMARVNQQVAKPERMMEYWRNVYDLVSAMQKEVTSVMQANYTQLTKTAASSIEHKKSSAIDGSDVIANAMKNMLEQTNKAFDNMTAVAGQMTNIANANIQAATSATAKAVESVTQINSKK